MPRRLWALNKEAERVKELLCIAAAGVMMWPLVVLSWKCFVKNVDSMWFWIKIREFNW